MNSRIEFDAAGAKKLLLWSILLELGFVFVYGADILLDTPIWTIHRLFDLDGEQNLPAWFSSVQLFLIGVVFWLKSRQCNTGEAPSSLFFLLVGLGFIFLSADEAASIHEQVSAILKKNTSMPRFKDGNGIWIFVYGTLAVALAFANFRPVVAMWSRYRRETRIMTAGMGLLALGAVCLEIVGYQYLRTGTTPMLYALEVAFEEFFEMCGASITLYGALLLLLNDSGAGSKS